MNVENQLTVGRGTSAIIGATCSTRASLGLKWSNSSKGDWKPELHEDQVEYEQEW